MQLVFKDDYSNLLDLKSFCFSVFKWLQVNNFFNSLSVMDMMVSLHSHRNPKIVQELCEILKIDIDIELFPLSLDACLRVAASAKAGERVGVRVSHHQLGSPSPSPC